MAGPANTRENEILSAIADTFVARTSLLPQAVLTAPLDAGDSILHVDTVDGFNKRGYVFWFDNTGERMAAIKAIDWDNNALTLDYSGYGERNLPVGLEFDHASGARIATNMMLHKPMSISAMLRSGKPVVAMWPRSKNNMEFSYGSTIAPILVRIQVHLALQQFDAAPMDSESFNDMQQAASRDAMQIVENALNNNRHLHTTYNQPGNHANGLGDGSKTMWAQSMWDTVIDNVDIPQAIGALETWVRPLRSTREA